MKTFESDLILTENTVFEDSITVHGNIYGKNGRRYNLTVYGNITSHHINAQDITALDITALDITALDIKAYDINAQEVDAQDIICESRKKKIPEAKTIARVFITEKSNLERKE